MGACTKSKNILSNQITITRRMQIKHNLNLPSQLLSYSLQGNFFCILFTVNTFCTNTILISLFSSLILLRKMENGKRKKRLVIPVLLMWQWITRMLILNNIHKNWKRYVPSLPGNYNIPERIWSTEFLICKNLYMNIICVNTGLQS